MRQYVRFLHVLSFTSHTLAWTVLPPSGCLQRTSSLLRPASARTTDDEEESTSSTSKIASLDPLIAQQFKIVTCNASACAEKRKRLQLDEYATYSSLYVRAKPHGIVVEETSCLGACQQAPCVGVEHEDYVGTVALEGMKEAEFANKVFFRIMDEDDAERVWQCVADGVQFMKEAVEDEQDEEDDRYV